MNHEALLTKFLAYAGNHGRSVYLDDSDLLGMREFPERFPVQFTDEEWRELQRLAREAGV